MDKGGPCATMGTMESGSPPPGPAPPEDRAPAEAARPCPEEIADRLIATYEADGAMSVAPGHELPSSGEVRRALGILRALIYPGFGGDQRAAGTTLRSHVESQLAQLRV